MAKHLRVGVIGCGNISTTYFKYGPLFKDIEIVACADLNADLAAARAREYGIVAMPTKDLLASKDIDIVVNLTVPAAHFAVSLMAVKAGKHVYSEKPVPRRCCTRCSAWPRCRRPTGCRSRSA